MVIFICLCLYKVVVVQPLDLFRIFNYHTKASAVRRNIGFFQYVIIYIAKIMGLLHASRVQRKVRYLSITVTETLNSISNLILTSFILKLVVRVFKNLG